MKNLFVLIVSVLTLSACSKKESNLVVKGNVDGLKKGTLYLQKIEGDSLVNIDSVVVRGDANFEIETSITSPQMMYLFLDKVDNGQYREKIEFFAEEGEIVINTSLKNFQLDAQVTGSSNQDKLAEYKKMMSRFQDSNLDLIQKNFEAQKNNNEEEIIATNREYDRLLARKYLYTVNFALNNKDLEIAPYLALSEVFDANIKYLDTIYNSMTPRVKESMYGKDLKDFLEERRELEKMEAKVEDQ